MVLNFVLASGSMVPLQASNTLTTSSIVSNYVIPAILFLVTLVVVYLIGRSVLIPLLTRVLKEQGHHPAVRSLAENVAGILVWVLAIALAFTVAGFGGVIAAFGVFAGAIVLAIGFAAQELLGNFVAGIFILKDRPFTIGDWIEWSGGEGQVEDIDLRVTRVRTFDNERITVPNGDLANDAVKNPVAYDKLRQKFVFGIGYDDDIDHAKEVILDEARQHDEILADPEPDIRVTELADSYVGLQTRFWIGEPGRGNVTRIRSELVQAVKERLDAEAIDMPYPVRTLEGSIEVSE
nr:mechanosensitive ion channel family protein [Haladaptatus sp. W1]